MNDQPQHPDKQPPEASRLDELLASYAAGGLTDEEAAELEALLRESGRATDDGLAYAAAALMRHETAPADVPAALRHRWENDAERFVRGDESGAVAGSIGGGARSGWPAFAAGALSAAAALLVSFVVWQAMPGAPGASDESGVGGGEVAIDPAPTPDQDWQTGRWSGGAPGYERVTGELRWSASRQGGTMTFTGLPANNPDQGQYQLWIVDPTRDAEPVDGGVFDVVADESGEAVVAFNAKLRVDNPVVFAITYEQPGGVVVSERPLLVTAALET